MFCGWKKLKLKRRFCFGRQSSVQDQNHRHQSTLSDRQTALLLLISDAVKKSHGDRITYCSEWLGYLPYGLYHWIEVDGRDISDQIPDMDGISADLQQLVLLNKLQVVSGDFEASAVDSLEAVCIEFALQSPVN
ncbi:hypothetical protein KUV57_11170 [Epibacterium sp. DP7N7-1]|nr:hypothetical protein [Epibacterium sp. DP7N7-1]